MAAFLILEVIQKVSHLLESILDNMREGKVTVSEEVLHDILGGMDLLKSLLRNLETALEQRSTGNDKTFTIELGEFEGQSVVSGLNALLPAEKALGGGRVDPEEPEINDEMRKAFVKDSDDLLDNLEQTLLELGKNPENSDLWSQAFRHVHTFKGNCGFYGYADPEKLSHALETEWESLQERPLEELQGILESGLDLLDVLKKCIRSIDVEGNPAIPDLASHLAKMRSAVPETSEEASSRRPLGEILLEQGVISDDILEKALDTQRKEASGERVFTGSKDKTGGSTVRRDLRVELSKLDLLLDLVGELVISTGMILNHKALQCAESEDLEKISHQLRTVVNELQNVALGVRMIPIEGAFRRMSRLVHDLSGKSGKKARLELVGEKTEVDKNVVDNITDPLVHMIRNSIDHGLETPEEREASGKPTQGTVLLSASQEGGEICITVRDDGRGMNRARILSKAVERGLISADRAEKLPDEDVFQFIFHPGFSTAESVTSTSGRGVGMDVVKSNIEKLNGRISIKSQLGKGSSITLRIPLTLAILDGMLIRVGNILFLLPLLCLNETIAAKADQISRIAGDQEGILLRGRFFPILRLHKLYGIDTQVKNISDGILVLIESQGEYCCLFADEILGQRQTVVKSLPPSMGKVAGISSCSILNTGEISLILDAAGVFARGRDLSDTLPEVAETV